MGQSITASLFSRFAQAFSSPALSSDGFVGTPNNVGSDFVPSVGDRYQHVREGASPWIVQGVLSVRASQIPLVSLINEKRPELSKILSVSALQDREEFTKVH